MRRLLLLLGIASAACTTTTTMTTGVPHASLIVDDHDYGPVPDKGLDVEAKAGFAPLHWQLVDTDKNVVAEGDLERTEPQWGVVAGAVAGAFCCVPAAAGAGLCLANPAVIVGSLACLVVGPGGVLGALQAPGWLSIPLGCTGAAAGASPLLLGLVGAAPPPVATLEPGEKPPEPPSTAQNEEHKW